MKANLITAMIAATMLSGCVSAPEPVSVPQRYSGVMLIWFEGQSFRADGQREPWAYGMSPEAMRELAEAYPEGYAPGATPTTIVVTVEGELRPVHPDARRYGCVGGCYDHYLTITRVHEARLLRDACARVLRHVYFSSNGAALDAWAAAIIDEAVREARRGACITSRINVIGHADTVGSTAHNLELSQARAAVVRDALVARGVDAALITTEGVGEARPQYRTADRVSEPINRIVEIIIEGSTAETP
jgi:outer membrane protein OmpA-like peptidoglycan-associated protein